MECTLDNTMYACGAGDSVSVPNVELLSVDF